MAAQSRRLQEVSQKNLEMVQGNDEVYRAQSKLRNFTTRALEPYILTNVQNIVMIIENKKLGITYFTSDLGGASPTSIIEDETQGIYRIEVPKAITDVIPIDIHNYHIYILTQTGLKRTAVMGKIIVVDD